MIASAIRFIPIRAAVDADTAAVVTADPGATVLLLKRLIPTRMIANAFTDDVVKAEAAGASREELEDLLGKGRAKAGIFDGNLEDGEIEVGQCSGLIGEILPAREIICRLIDQCRKILPRGTGRNAEQGSEIA